jgi:hypothetical protein
MRSQPGKDDVNVLAALLAMVSYVEKIQIWVNFNRFD